MTIKDHTHKFFDHIGIICNALTTTRTKDFAKRTIDKIAYKYGWDNFNFDAMLLYNDNIHKNPLKVYSSITASDSCYFSNLKYKITKDIFNYSTNIEVLYDLIVSFYDETNTNRCSELLWCLQRNILNPHIQNIIILYERSYGFMYDRLINLHDKLHIVNMSTRPTFNDFIKYSSTYLNGRHIILANSDIIFTSTLRLLTQQHLDSNIMFVLTFTLFLVWKL